MVGGSKGGSGMKPVAGREESTQAGAWELWLSGPK
jgi:hypothetical protein